MVSKEQAVSAAKLIDSLYYYTPSIKDIHVGYEAEVSPKDKNLWGLTILDSSYILSIENEVWEIRTFYLTKEQIKSEGWKHIGGHMISNGKEVFTFKSYILEYSFQNKKLVIKLCYGTGIMIHPDTLFDGVCPSINEFRKIVKLLGIVK